MRARLLLSAAVATLSLCISHGNAQPAGRDQAGGEAGRPGQTEPATPQVKPGEQGAAEKDAQERRSERTQEQNRNRAEAQGARETERQGLSDQEKAGRRGAKEMKDEDRRRKQGAADENRESGPGAKGARQKSGDRPDATTRGAKEPDKREKTGGAEAPTDERTGTARSDRERRQGEAGRSERSGDVFGRSPEADRTRGAETTTPREDRDAAGRADREQPRAGRNGQERGAVRLSEREQSRVRDIIERRGVRSIPRGDFNARIGAVLPPTVQFYPLPEEIVSILPQYRGYNFVRVEDQIAIIDPGSRQVVTMIGEGAPGAVYGYEERGGGYERREGRYDRREGGRYGSARRDESYGRERGSRGEAYGYAPRVRLDSREERALYRGVMREARTSMRQVCVRVGDRVPEFVDIEPVPRQIAAEAPDVERFDYFVLNDQVVLVDPDSRRVVDIVEEPR
ncbi:DUF1236 domain-containing protein [Methylocystis sp. S23]